MSLLTQAALPPTPLPSPDSSCCFLWLPKTSHPPSVLIWNSLNCFTQSSGNFIPLLAWAATSKLTACKCTSSSLPMLVAMGLSSQGILGISTGMFCPITNSCAWVSNHSCTPPSPPHPGAPMCPFRVLYPQSASRGLLNGTRPWDLPGPWTDLRFLLKIYTQLLI